LFLTLSDRYILLSALLSGIRLSDSRMLNPPDLADPFDAA